ncbi:MAG: CoA ester lyase [Gammaproteobacteria bacterium]|nr:CoA ester lyase [Gammaproteobacteria bacterium]
MESHASEVIRLRRSVLYMPGSNKRALDKARTLPADALIMDLEDSVSPEAKNAARENVIAAIKAGGYDHRELVIRMNALHTPWGKEDLIAAATAAADAVLVPKIDDAAELNKVVDLLEINGAPKQLKVWAMAETPRAIININSIARADARLSALVMGTSDLAKTLRIRADSDRSGLRAALSSCVLAARAYGIDILDGVHTDLADSAGFSKSCDQARMLGFDGKTLIHPSQIEVANKAFGVSAEQLAHAAEVIAAWDAAAAQGLGIAILDGQMIEKLHADEARRALALNAAIIRNQRTSQEE